MKCTQKWASAVPGATQALGPRYACAMVRRGVALVLILVGATWIVQGFGIVPTGSFMDGHLVWGIIGLGCVALALVTLGYDRWRKLRSRP